MKIETLYIVTIIWGGNNIANGEMEKTFNTLKDAKEFLDICHATFVAECDFNDIKLFEMIFNDNGYFSIGECFNIWETGKVRKITNIII